LIGDVLSLARDRSIVWQLASEARSACRPLEFSRLLPAVVGLGAAYHANDERMADIERPAADLFGCGARSASITSPPALIRSITYVSGAGIRLSARIAAPQKRSST
jgi:hypothetical protein